MKRISANSQLVLRLILIAAILVSLQSSLVLAGGPASFQATQQDQSLKGAVLKGKVPVSKELLKVTLPRAKEARLQNGLHVIVLEDYDQLPTFSIEMIVLSGGLADPPNHKGLASFTASLLREGTAKRNSRELAEQIDSLGASLFASSGFSSLTTSVSASGLMETFDQVLDIFADVIRNPSFPAEELEKFRKRTLSQLQLQRSNPQFLAIERFNRAVYGDHPAGTISPPLDSLGKTTRDDLARFHSLHYRPNNAMIAVVGDVTLKGILPKLEKVFGNWEQGDTPSTRIPAVPEPAASKVHLIDRPNSVQTVLQFGNLAIERTHPDYFSLLVMNKVLGGGPAARLFMNLREDKGYTYGAGSSFSGSRFRGVWNASSSVRTEVTREALSEFLYEFKRIRDERVPETELENAKRSLIGSFALSLEQPQSLLQNIITQKLFDLPVDYWDTYPQRVAAVTAEEVQRVAKKYVDLPHMQIVAVGDASQIQALLQKYGRVEVYDADGNPAKPADGKAEGQAN